MASFCTQTERNISNGRELLRLGNRGVGVAEKTANGKAGNSFPNGKPKRKLPAAMESYKWKPGASGNYSGRPRTKPLADEMRKQLDEICKDPRLKKILPFMKRPDVPADSGEGAAHACDSGQRRGCEDYCRPYGGSGAYRERKRSVRRKVHSRRYAPP
jgi:hypothetical protein